VRAAGVGAKPISLEVRQIRAGEGLRLRALRLHALADAPTAFGSTFAREEAFPESVWHERAAGGAGGGDRITFVAEQDGQWVGLATGLAEDPEDPRQTGPVLVGMFVDPTARRHGVGAMLVEGVAGWARARGAARLSLWVFSSNEPAIALYRKCGFRPTGETKPLAHTPTLAELRMVRDVA
jgi:GNAT superfamily N-acetyltransferase